MEIFEASYTASYFVASPIRLKSRDLTLETTTKRKVITPTVVPTPGGFWGRVLHKTWACPIQSQFLTRRRSVKVLRVNKYIRSPTHCRSHIALFRLTNPAEMKYLVFVLLAAAACASEVEKREAEPSRDYNYGYGLHHHAYYPRTYYHPYHTYHKRSAEPEAEAEPSYGSYHYPGYYRPHSYGYHNTPYVHHHHKRSAEPEAEAEPSYQAYYHPYSYGYQTHHYIPSVHHHHKRSADPVAEAEASYAHRSYHPVYYPSYHYTPYSHSHHKRSAEPEADPGFAYGHHHQAVYRPYHSGAHYGYGYLAHHH
ncbi:uncharacterized protein [Penaeus vannamei]|uniref:uncharacterized protein n=1 Tax=Penaeus vannamei TaxID=6689 RepID=UPI00387F81ED